MLFRFVVASAICAVAMSKKLRSPERGLELRYTFFVGPDPYPTWDDDFSSKGSVAIENPKGIQFSYEYAKDVGSYFSMPFEKSRVIQVCSKDEGECVAKQPCDESDPRCHNGRYICAGKAFYDNDEMFENVKKLSAAANWTGTDLCPDFLETARGARCDRYDAYDLFKDSAIVQIYALEGLESPLGTMMEPTHDDDTLGNLTKYTVFEAWEVDPPISPQRFQEFPCHPRPVATKLRGSRVTSGASRPVEMPTVRLPWFG